MEKPVVLIQPTFDPEAAERAREKRRLDQIAAIVPKMNRRQRRAYASARRAGADAEQAFKVARARR